MRDTAFALFRGHEWVGALQRIPDALFIVGGHHLACWAYRDSWRPSMTVATAIAVVLYGMVAELNGIYGSGRSERLTRWVGAVLTSWLVVPVLLVAVAFATKTSADYSRVVSILWFVTTAVLLTGWRFGMRLVERRVLASGRAGRRVAILGATPSAEILCESIASRPWLGLRLAGVYEDRTPSRRHPFKKSYCPILGGTDALIRDAREGKVDLVYIALPLRAEARIGRVLRELADATATVFLLADFFTYDLLHGQWSQVGDVPVVSVYDSPFRGPGGWLKRLEDLLLGGIILFVIALPLLVIAALVKLTSAGPVFFLQRRYGLNGKQIRVLKFRTMTVMEDDPREIKQATKDDVRVTRLGRFLRRTSLDELPQFLQVMTGEMSIVGPRPHAVAHNEQYRTLIQGYMLRHKVKPGITGWAQVNGWRGETDNVEKMERRVQHDLEYIQNWNLLLDLKIIALTVVGAKKKQNAF